MPDEQNPDDDDKFRPEAIAARVDQIGDETETDRIAREEERKLLARRKEQKKSGLQSAASKRLSKIGEAKVKRPSEVGAVPQQDPLLDRVARAVSRGRGRSGGPGGPGGGPGGSGGTGAPDGRSGTRGYGAPRGL